MNQSMNQTTDSIRFFNDNLSFFAQSAGTVEYTCNIVPANYTYTYACRDIYNTIKTSGHSSSEKYTSHFIWKGSEGLRRLLLCERWVGNWTELQHIDPHSSGYHSLSFLSSWAA